MNGLATNGTGISKQANAKLRGRTGTVVSKQAYAKLRAGMVVSKTANAKLKGSERSFRSKLITGAGKIVSK